MARSGYCANTWASAVLADCDADRVGAFNLAGGYTLEACRRRCAACANCIFYSFSVRHQDCSWFSFCDFDHLKQDVPGFITDRMPMSRPRAARRPTLLIIYHIAKTGGSALNKLVNGWAWRHVRALSPSKGHEGKPAAISRPVFFGKGMHPCFFNLFPDVRTPPFGQARLRVCEDPQWRDVQWNSSDIAVEFHNELASYWELLPALAHIRRLYAQLHGTVVATTSLREPVDLINSVYRMWPPRVPLTSGQPRSRTGLVLEGRHEIMPFHEYVTTLIAGKPQLGCPNINGLVAGLDQRRESGRAVSGFDCAAALGNARRRLSTFDEVGVTECTPCFWRRLGRRLGWAIFFEPTILRAAIADGTIFKPQETNSVVKRWADASAAEAHSAAVQLALLRSAAPDALVYADAARAAGVTEYRSRNSTGRVGFPVPVCPPDS